MTKKRPVIDRLMDRVRVDGSGCWLWTGPTTAKGYGQMGAGPGRTDRVHRLSYEEHIGPIPDELQLDHLCRNRACVNPAHLEPVTNRENVLRGAGPTAVNAAKTHCIHGHLLSGGNLIHQGGGRRCRMCQTNRKRNRRKAP